MKPLERILKVYQDISSKQFGAYRTDGYVVVWAEVDPIAVSSFGIPNTGVLCADVVVPSLERDPHDPQDRRNSVSFYMKYLECVEGPCSDCDIKNLKACEIQSNLFGDFHRQFYTRNAFFDLMFDDKICRPTFYWNFDEVGRVIDTIDSVMDLYTKFNRI